MTSTPPSRLSRGDIEDLCLLSAIPDEGCTLIELPNRLGLSPLLAETLSEAIDQLVNAGWIQEHDGRLTVTAAGRRGVEERVSGIE